MSTESKHVQRPPPERRCKAKSKRRQARCKAWAVPGGTVCHYHGGLQQKLAGQRKVDPRVGGRPPIHGLYAKRIHPSVQEVYDAAGSGDLDEELKVARSNLAFALDKFQRAAAAKSAYWLNIVGEHLDHVRKLEFARSAILARGGFDPKFAKPPEIVYIEDEIGVPLTPAASDGGNGAPGSRGNGAGGNGDRRRA